MLSCSGSTIVKTGAIIGQLHVVHSGEISEMENGRALRTLKKGDYFGEVRMSNWRSVSDKSTPAQATHVLSHVDFAVPNGMFLVGVALSACDGHKYTGGGLHRCVYGRLARDRR